MRTSLLIVVVIVLQVPLYGQKPDKTLTKKLQTLVHDFKGNVGVYVQHLKTGKTVEINADSLYPTASMIKVPITIGVFDKIEKGYLDYDSTLTYNDSLLYPGEDILGSFKNGEKISLAKVMMLMITTSDNTASLWSQQIAGTGSDINSWLMNNGYIHTRVNSRTKGREADWSKYGWGQTTPREMADIFVRIRQGKVISSRASERIYRNLIRIFWDTNALSQIPPYIQAASKQGALDQSKSEVVLVNAPHGDYIFCVITKNQKDMSWTSANEGSVLIRAVSRTLWEYFESDDKWEPAAKVAEWY